MNGSVLIIDRDVNAQIIAGTLLRLRGLDVHVATDPVEAGQILAHEKVGVVVVDVNGTATKGFEVFQRLRAAAQALPIPPRLVVVTDRREPELERFARRLGVAAVLRKPMNHRQFIATVEGLVDSATPQAA
jgi:CheY-like chemotaxis protein